jgi:transposase
MLFAHLAERLSQSPLAATSSQWLIVDSPPDGLFVSPEMACFVRSQSNRLGMIEAEYGYMPSKKRHFFGFRLHLLVNGQGSIVDFGVSAANASERLMALELLRGRPGYAGTRRGVVLADNGYSGAYWAVLFQNQGHQVWASLRPNTAAQSKPAGPRWDEAWLRRFLRGKRDLIETVFSMLADPFKLETTRTKTLWGS